MKDSSALVAASAVAATAVAVLTVRRLRRSSSSPRHARPRGGVPRYVLGGGLEISRLVCGLWQVADLERVGGKGLTRAAAIGALEAHRDAGLTTFDMADHYGSAEELIGALDGRFEAMTKWCPKPGPENATRAAVDAAVARARRRMRTSTIRLMQFHTWDYLDGPGYWLEQVMRSPPPPRARTAHTRADHTTRGAVPTISLVPRTRHERAPLARPVHPSPPPRRSWAVAGPLSARCDAPAPAARGAPRDRADWRDELRRGARARRARLGRAARDEPG